MGYELDHMIELNRRSFVKASPISDFTIPLVSLIAGDRMSRTLKKMFGDARIEDQRRPYFCVATNLSRATVTVHQQGSLAFAVGTSIAIPGLAPPLIQDGDFLVDGGLLENVPVGVMRRVSQGRVFTVDVSKRVEFTTTREPYHALSGWRVLRERIARVGRRATVPSMYKLLWRATVLNSIHRSEEVRRSSDVYIHPTLDDIEIFEWKEIDRAIEAGYRAAIEALSGGEPAASHACEEDAALSPVSSRSFAVSKSPAPSNCHATGSETMLRSPRSAICEM
jgi:NTE family protein